MPRCTPSAWTSAGLQEDTTCLSSIPVYNKIIWVIQTGYPKAIFSMSTRKQHMNWAEFPLKMRYATISNCLLLFSVLPSQKLVLYRPVPAKHSRVMRNLGGIKGAFQRHFRRKSICVEKREVDYCPHRSQGSTMGLATAWPAGLDMVQNQPSH